jgi:hypothetical protein
MDRLRCDDDNALRKRKPRILFVALANDIGTDRLPAALAARGAGIAVLSPPGFYAAAVQAARWFPLPAHRGLWLGVAFLRPRLQAACREWDADLVVPLDSVAAQCLRVIATSKSITPQLRLLLQRSFGPASGYAPLCSRSGLMLLAGGLGVHLPRYCVSADPAVLLDQARSWGFPVVLKAENTCGGHGVTIARTPDELRAAIADLRDGSLKRRARRALGQLFWTMAGLNDTASAPPLLQSFMPGIPAMRTVSAWQGEVLDGVSFVAERIHPAPTGPSTVVRFVDNAEMAETARRIVAALGCSGFVSFDFMLDETTGRAALIEANPRPIGTTHLAALYGHDACAPLLARLAGRPVPVQPEIVGPPLIALFPKEIERDPQNLSRLHAPPLHLDVPSGEPGVMALYLQRLGQIHPGRLAEIVDAVGPGTRLRPDGRHPVRPPRAFEEAFSRSP